MNHRLGKVWENQNRKQRVLPTGKREAHMSAYDQKTIGLCNFVYVFKRWGSKFEGNSQLRPAASESLRAQGLYIAVVPFLAFTGGKPGTCSCGYLRKCWETPFHPYSWTNPYMSNVGKPIINHPFGNGLYKLFLVMTGGWFIIVLPTLLVLHVLVHQQKYGHKSIPLHSTPRPHMRSWNCHTSPNLVATHRSCSWRLHVVWRSSLVIRRNQTHTHTYICTKTNTVVNTDTKKRCNHSKIKMPTEDPALAHIDM